MLKPFWQILKEYKEVEELLEYDEVTDELIEKLTINKSELEEKTEDLIGLDNYYETELSKCDAEILFYKSEIERVKQQYNRIEKKKNRVKQFIFDAVKLFGKKNKTGNPELQVGSYKLRVGTTKSVEITDMDRLPRSVINYKIGDSFNYYTIQVLQEKFDINKVTEQADKTAIKKHLDQGDIINGAEIVEKETLYIK